MPGSILLFVSGKTILIVTLLGPVSDVAPLLSISLNVGSCTILPLSSVTDSLGSLNALSFSDTLLSVNVVVLLIAPLICLAISFCSDERLLYNFLLVRKSPFLLK